MGTFNFENFPVFIYATLIMAHSNCRCVFGEIKRILQLKILVHIMSKESRKIRNTVLMPYSAVLFILSLFNVRSPITPSTLGLTTQKSCCIQKLISSKNSSIALHQKTIYHIEDKSPRDEKKGGCDIVKNRYPC